MIYNDNLLATHTCNIQWWYRDLIITKHSFSEREKWEILALVYIYSNSHWTTIVRTLQSRSGEGFLVIFHYASWQWQTSLLFSMFHNFTLWKFFSASSFLKRALKYMISKQLFSLHPAHRILKAQLFSEFYTISFSLIF